MILFLPVNIYMKFYHSTRKKTNEVLICLLQARPQLVYVPTNLWCVVAYGGDVTLRTSVTDPAIDFRLSFLPEHPQKITIYS